MSHLDDTLQALEQARQLYAHAAEQLRAALESAAAGVEVSTALGVPDLVGLWGVAQSELETFEAATEALDADIIRVQAALEEVRRTV